MENKDAPLAALLAELKHPGEEPDREEILALFLKYAESLGIKLYPHQEEAVLDLLEWNHLVLNTPTGSGKSLVAIALLFQAMAEGRTSYYTCPIKALVNEKFFDLCDAFGPANVGLLTGDAAVNREAPIICCTAEVLANMALRQEEIDVGYVVMDEFHFYGDEDRGGAWQIPLIAMRDAVFCMMSATLGDVSHIVERLSRFTDRDVKVISKAERPVPLYFEYCETPIHETIRNLLEADSAPIYLVNFTQRASAEQAQALTSVDILTREAKESVVRELEKARFDTPYGKEIRRFLKAGIGVHHAGLLPKYRLLVEKLSQAGLLKVICGTDSLGAGVNMPIRTVLFSQLCKYDGNKTRLLTARQFHQMAGRAGRKGFDVSGRVVVQAPEHVIENKQIEAKAVKNPHLRNKLVKKKPPSRGYVHWDKSSFEKLVASPPEPLEPKLEVSHGMLMNALQAGQGRAGGGYRRLMELIDRSHILDGLKRRERKRAAALFRSLVRAGIVEIVAAEGRPGSTAVVRSGLQRDFSLNHTLSLYLVEALDLLDPESETFALDVLSFVESIIEDPDVILFRQVDKWKDELMARLKAEGVGYDERIAELDKVEHPKPNADLIYESFNTFAEFHPWIDDENIKPKSIAREMYEKCMGFCDYVSEYGLARSEGVLLRYLSQVYKTFVQTVPSSYRNEEIDEMLEYFHTVLQRIDSSLLEEWELMMDGGIVRPSARKKETTRPQVRDDIAADFKQFSARIRSELYMLQRSLADRNYEQACELIRRAEESQWSPSRMKKEMSAYWAEHSGIDVTAKARHPQNTVIRESGPRRWDVQQKIADPEGDCDWAIRCIVDLAGRKDDAEPLIELIAIGI